MDRLKIMVDQYRYFIISGLGILSIVLLLFLGFNSLKSTDDKKVNAFSESSFSSMSSESKIVSSTEVKKKPTAEGVYVDVKGAVKNPGLYQLRSDLRVSNAISQAGGFKKNADDRSINLAQKLTDQQIIYVPVKGESQSTPIVSETGTSSTAGDVSNSETEKVNLNTADKTQMQQINGVGEKRAEQIIAYRNEHGQFNKIEDLKNVSGFGDKMFENAKDSITV